MTRLTRMLWLSRVMVAVAMVSLCSLPSMTNFSHAQESDGADPVAREACREERQLQGELAFTSIQEWQSESRGVVNFQQAPFINEQNELFIFTVIGQEPDAVERYIGGASYCFDFLPASFTGGSEVSDAESPEISENLEPGGDTAAANVAIVVRFVGEFAPDIDTMDPDVIALLDAALVEAGPELPQDILTAQLAQSTDGAFMSAAALVEQGGGNFSIDFAIGQKFIGDNEYHRYRLPDDGKQASFGITVPNGSVSASLSAPSRQDLGEVDVVAPTDGESSQGGSLPEDGIADGEVNFCAKVLGLADKSEYQLWGRVGSDDWSSDTVVFEPGDC